VAWPCETYTHIHALSLSLFLSLSHTHTHIHKHTRAHTHTHTPCGIALPHGSCAPPCGISLPHNSHTVEHSYQGHCLPPYGPAYRRALRTTRTRLRTRMCHACVPGNGLQGYQGDTGNEKSAFLMYANLRSTPHSHSVEYEGCADPEFRGVT
jgi:hypothetical protein